MSFQDADIAEKTDTPPRARGGMWLSAKRVGPKTAIDSLRTSGSTKALFTHGSNLNAIMINTSGGLTGGDRFTTEVTAGPGCNVVLTTQAAERAYKSISGAAQVETQLSIQDRAFLYWLPQELIVFDGSALDRRLTIDLAQSARLLMVEPIVFGRTAMGERVNAVHFNDRVEITCMGRPLFRDHVRIAGDAEATLSQPAVCRTARAMASLVYRAPDAAARIGPVRALLPETGGASLLSDDLMVLRLLAKDAFLLRQSLIPVLETLKGDALPRSWSL